MTAAPGQRISDEERSAPDALAIALANDLDGHFERLVLAYQDRLYTFAVRLCGNRQDAEEVAQDTFVRAYRALCTYPPERVRALAPRPWLYQIALNVARNRRRGRRLDVVPLAAPDDGQPDGAWPAPTDDAAERPDARYARAEASSELAAVVATLPDRYRIPVLLRHMAGLGYGEIALALGQPVGTVKANVHRGVRALRAILTEKQDDRCE